MNLYRVNTTMVNRRKCACSAVLLRCCVKTTVRGQCRWVGGLEWCRSSAPGSRSVRLSARSLLYSEIALYNYGSCVPRRMRAVEGVRCERDLVCELTRPAVNGGAFLRPVYQSSRGGAIISVGGTVSSHVYAYQCDVRCACSLLFSIGSNYFLSY